jgi:hypothetical protein
MSDGLGHATMLETDGVGAMQLDQFAYYSNEGLEAGGLHGTNEGGLLGSTNRVDVFQNGFHCIVL